MGKETVLVIEDTDLNLKLVKTLLHFGHYNILEAYSAENGIQLARSHRPDLILMDIQLPGMDGLTATRLIRSDKSIADIPVVAVTSHAMKGDREAAMEAGFTGYITKPIDTRRFLDTLSEYIKPNGKRTDETISEAGLMNDMKAGKGSASASEAVPEETVTVLDAAICDQQTGLYSYGYFCHLLDLEYKRFQRENHPFSVMVIDTAELLSGNHSDPVISDRDIMAGFAQVVQENIRDIDLPAKFNKGKISVLMPLADRKSAAAVADRIRHAAGAFSTHTDHDVGLGICSFPSDATTLEELMHIADTRFSSL